MMEVVGMGIRLQVGRRGGGRMFFGVVCWQ